MLSFSTSFLHPSTFREEPKDIPYEEFPFNPESQNPILLVKDFNRHALPGTAALPVNQALMTNADVPTLAVQGVIPNPVNPFTGKPITTDAKRETLYVTHNVKWWPYNHPGNTFNIQPEQWYTVKDNIFDPANWRQEQPEE